MSSSKQKDYDQLSIDAHKKYGGKLKVESKTHCHLDKGRDLCSAVFIT